MLSGSEPDQPATQSSEAVEMATLRSKAKRSASRATQKTEAKKIVSRKKKTGIPEPRKSPNSSNTDEGAASLRSKTKRTAPKIAARKTVSRKKKPVTE